MRISIRKKLIFAFSILVLVLFATMAYLFIQEKKEELAKDIYVNTLAFSKLTSERVAYDYDLYLAQNSFVYFNREIQKVFAQNIDVDRIRVVSYEGETLYDSAKDIDSRYEGAPRKVDKVLMQQIKSENISWKTEAGEVFYLKGDSYVDDKENAKTGFDPATLLEYFVVSGNEKYSIVYDLNYENLNQRIDQMIERIIYLAVFGVMLGVLMSFFMSGKVTKPISKLVASAGEIAKGDFKVHVDIDTSDEISDLGDSFNKMADELEASMAAKVYQERVMQELELANEIQTHLVPKDVPTMAGIDISAGLIPAEEIGGDIYDFLKINEKRMLMYLGDVTGHGVPAGIVSSVANALFYGYRHNGDLKEILVSVNSVLKAKSLSNMFMTLCLMEWDAEGQNFSYVSAGHEQIVHYKARAQEVVLEPSGGVALGMIPDLSPHIQLQSVDFAVGDFLVIYSDGIPEAWRNETEVYGMERLSKIVDQAGRTASTAAELQKIILDDVNAYRNNHQQMDDITIMVLRRK